MALQNHGTSCKGCAVLHCAVPCSIRHGFHAGPQLAGLAVRLHHGHHTCRHSWPCDPGRSCCGCGGVPSTWSGQVSRLTQAHEPATAQLHTYRWSAVTKKFSPALRPIGRYWPAQIPTLTQCNAGFCGLGHGANSDMGACISVFVGLPSSTMPQVGTTTP